ncbi:MAG: sodium:alanine symporter family protein [Bacteroidales bacterium]|nr:sodium:alanine symporter family protein [Candidatus Liminaster caballi]
MDSFLSIANEILNTVNGFLWGWPMIILLVGTHLYLTILLRVPQLHIGKAIRLSISRDKEAHGDVSQFSALATGLAATIGTGNIIGVATAVMHGGPGAVFWCWVTGLFGIATKYAEALLAVKYRVRASNGKMIGGPMYSIERGMKCRWLAVAFAACAFLASFGIGCMVQSNAISTTAADSFGISTQTTGYVLATLVAAVVFFGVKGIAKVCESLVPFMAAFYVVGCLVLLAINVQYIIPALCAIVTQAFSTEAMEGGAAGSVIMLAMRYGVARGLFSNEAGLGSAPIVAAAARTKNPVRQALVSSTSVFWDTVIICALTGLVLVSTIIAPNGIDVSAGDALTKRAFEQIPLSIAGVSVGKVMLSIAIFTFAFSTILGWAYYGEKSLEYLCGRHGRTGRYVYRVLIIIGSFFGANWALDLVWNFGDTANALMAIPNLVCLLALSGVLVRETRHYLWEDRLDEQGE